MITTKAQMLKVIATCAQPHVLTREEKFKYFVEYVITCSKRVESPKQTTLAGLMFSND